MNFALLLAAVACAVIAALVGFSVIDSVYYQGWLAASLGCLAAAQLPWRR